MSRDKKAGVEATGRIADPKATPLAVAKWESSGLSHVHAQKLGLTPLEPGETAELLSNIRYKVESLKIPYFDLAGQPTDFFRVRFLGKLPGFAGKVEKPQRYAQPKGTVNEVYFPPLLDRSWAEIANDINVTIHITEGELKAACACAHGIPTLGLGGVDVWKATKKGIDFLPAMAAIAWPGRKVAIIYDSDAATNPNVVRAQNALAQKLSDKGALPLIASLPPTPDGQKQGLDDFIVAQGAEALVEVLAEAPPFGEAKALWEMNEEIIYIKEPGICIVRATGQKLAPIAFVAHAYANRHYMAIEQKQGLSILKKKKLAPHWLEWGHRSELQKMTYAPGQPQIHEGRWNTWQGWGCKPAKGDMSVWHTLLDHLFESDPPSRKWFEQWCAYPLQFPGTKLYTAAMIWGQKKGTGKTFTAYSLMKIYGQNAIEIKSKDLRGGFNGWQENRQFIYADEVAGADAGTKRIDSEWLKGLITQEYVKINVKYLPEIVLPDVMNFMFTSNNPDALFIENGDRRYFVHEVVGPALDRAFYDKAHAWLHGSGPSHLFHYLLNLDLTGFNPREHAPVTAAKEAMTRDCKSDVGSWVQMLEECPEIALAPLGPDAANKGALFTTTQLLTAYDPDRKNKVMAPGLGRELKRAGFRQTGSIRICRGVQRLWIVRDQKTWAKANPKLMRQHFDTLFGPGTGQFD